MATFGDQSHRTAKAIAWLKANYAEPPHVEELAEVARMGMSTLHHHFRALTAMSPLQYQKQLRLVAARERMLIEGLDAANAAFEVAYERPESIQPGVQTLLRSTTHARRQNASIFGVHNTSRLIRFGVLSPFLNVISPRRYP